MASEHSGSPVQMQEYEPTDNVMPAHTDPRQQPLLLVTTVDIGEGKSDRIEVREGDIPMDVAREFVIKHGLPPAIIPRLAVHLEENLAKVAAQKHASGDAHEHHGASQDENERIAVFHRLYEQAVALRHKLDDKRDEIKKQELESIKTNKTSMSWISSEMMKDRSSGPFGNYGEMLYAESLEAMARKQEKADRWKAEKQLEEVAGATFKPEISRLAQNLWAPHECRAAPAWQRLSKVKMTKAQERLEMLRREKEEAEVKECTFKPQTNTRSNKLMTQRSEALRSLNVSAHQQLYQDAIRRQQKMQDYQHWYPEEVTFQPKLHESAMSREFLRKSLGPEGAAMLAASGEERHKALVDRLYASYEKLQTKLAEARSTLQSAVDPATGKELFKPETGRAPKFTRNSAHVPVGEYLYNLKQQQEEKARAVAEEIERKRKEDAERGKQTQTSKQLVKALQQKRFKQIFDFLDQEGLGSLNLLALMNAMPEWLDDLDDEVRADLEMAAKILGKRVLRHNDSGKSDVSSIFMPPPPSAFEVQEATCDADGSNSCSTPSGTPGIVSLQHFCALMEEVLQARRGPRTYLAPSPPRRYVPSETYKPQIDKRSEQLAAKVRPKESSVLQQKNNERRARAVAEEASSCTFAPQLVSQQLVKEGRVMRGVREGTWYHKSGGSELDCAASLQDLAALMSEPLQTSASAPAAASNSGNLVTPPRSPVKQEAASAEHEAASDSPVTAHEEQLQQLQLQLEQLAHETVEQSPVFKKQDSSRRRASRQQSRHMREEQQWQQQQLQLDQVAQQAQAAHEEEASPESSAVDAAAAAAAEQGFESDDFEGSEEQRQYLELEREVQTMLEATSAAAAAAAHLQSHSDQQYLSEILGLAQEQVDALAPAISNLKGLDAQHSRGASILAEPPQGGLVEAAAGQIADPQRNATPSTAAPHATQAVHAEDLMQFTPQSSFKVSKTSISAAEEQKGSKAIADCTASPPRSYASAVGISSSPSRHSPPGSLSRQDSSTAERPQGLTASRQGSIKEQLAGISSSGQSFKQQPLRQQPADFIGSSKKLLEIEGMDLFELAADLKNAGN